MLLTFGPFRSKPNSCGSSKTILGVVLDVFDKSSDPSSWVTGTGVYTAISDGSGNLIIDIPINIHSPNPTLNYFGRLTFPIGSWDTNRPDYVHQVRIELIPNQSKSNTQGYWL